MKQPIWQSITPEELAEQEAKQHKLSPSQMLQRTLSWEWARKAKELRGTNRDKDHKLGHRVR